MVISEQLTSHIKDAMKAKAKVKLEALRAIKKVFIEAKSANGAGSELSDEEEIKIITKLVKQGKDSAKLYKDQGREDLYDQEMEQVEVMSQFLPEQMSEEDIEKAVASIIATVGATSMQQMGQVMGQASKQLAGKADGGVISTIVKRLLS